MTKSTRTNIRNVNVSPSH